MTRFAPGRAWRARDLQGNARLAAVAELLRRVHAIRVPGVPRLDLEETLRSYAALAGGAVARRAARQGIALARAAGLGEGEPVLCHHDPIAANLVGFRRMVLIDWEYSACGDLLLDLAVVIRHHRLAPRRAVAFARAYFGDAAVPWERLALACRTYDVLLSLWLRAMQGAGRITARQQQQLKPLALPGIM